MNRFVIYKATFPNNKVYIGKTRNFKNRIYKHKWDSDNKFDSSIIMHKSIQKYGFDRIKWEIIHECDSLENMSEMEIYYINQYNSLLHDYGYNMVCGDKKVYEKSTNISDEYRLEMVKNKLESNGYDSSKYVELTPELEMEIIDEYLSGGMIRRMSAKYKITRNRIKRLLQKNNIETEYRNDNQFQPDDSTINSIKEKYLNKLTIKQISTDLDITTMLISRVLHDLNLRESKRFKDGKRYDGVRKPHHKPRKTYKEDSRVY